MTKLRTVLLALALMMPSMAAFGANVFPDPDGNNFGGQVVICLNANAKAVPCGQASTVGVTITSGQSLSPAVNLSTGSARLVRITIPAGGWTAANLTFQSSADCTTYGNLRDASGNEYSATVVAAGDEIIIPYADFIGIRCLKVRSGTSAAPVVQGADRALVLSVIP